jgi:hypothetical protein
MPIGNPRSDRAHAVMTVTVPASETVLTPNPAMKSNAQITTRSFAKLTSSAQLLISTVPANNTMRVPTRSISMPVKRPETIHPSDTKDTTAPICASVR